VQKVSIIAPKSIFYVANSEVDSKRYLIIDYLVGEGMYGDWILPQIFLEKDIFYSKREA
jgi:hypothetical protein